MAFTFDLQGYLHSDSGTRKSCTT